MLGWVVFEECGRRYRVAGLDGLEAGLRKASWEMQELIHDRLVSARAALERFYGRPAYEFAERVNRMLAAMVDLEGALAEAAAAIHRFPEGRLGLAHVVEAGRARGHRPPRVEPPAGPPGRVGADMDALRRYVGAAPHFDDWVGWLPRAADLDDVMAMEGRAPAGFFGVVEDAVAAAVPTLDDPGEWDRIRAEHLVPLPDLRPLAQAVRSHSMDAAQIAIATAEAYERADAELVALLGRHPDLAGYVSAAFGSKRMGGGAALALAAAHFGRLDAAGGRRDGLLSKAGLGRIAADANAAEHLRDAAQRLLDSPGLFALMAGGDGLVTRRDILRHLAANRSYTVAWEHLAALDVAAEGGKPDGKVSRADLEAAARNTALSVEVRRAARLLLRRGEDGFDRDGLVARLVNGHAFTDDPAAARRFVESLPVAGGGRPGIEIGVCSTDGVQALADAALLDAGNSLTAQQSVIAHLPETDKGTRNQLITAFYDILGDKVDAVLAGPAAGNPSNPGHPGANWLMYAPWASEGVNRIVTGDLQVAGVGPFQYMRQGAADGNQWIFDDITSRFAAFVELHQANPAPSAAQLQRFFADHFTEGDATIRKGFAAYVAAMAEDDPARRQALMFEGNISVATHEQAGAQPYLEEVGRWVPDRLEGRWADIRVGDAIVEVDRSVPHLRAPNHVQTMDILDLDPAARTVADYSTSGVTFTDDPTVSGPGVVHLPDIGGVEGFPTSMRDWHSEGGEVRRPGIGTGSVGTWADPEGGPGSGAVEWSDPNERMWSITKLFEQGHSYEPLWDTDPLERSFNDYSWLSEEAKPR